MTSVKRRMVRGSASLATRQIVQLICYMDQQYIKDERGMTVYVTYSDVVADATGSIVVVFHQYQKSVRVYKHTKN